MRNLDKQAIDSVLVSEGEVDDIQWAIDRLKTIAMTAESTYEQCNACEQIIRCVRIIAGLVEDA